MAEAAKPAGKVAKKDAKEPVKKEASKKDMPKVNRVEEIKKFFNGTKSELKKVHWPNRQQVMIYTLVVLVAVVLMSFIIWIADLGLSALLERLIAK